MTHLYYAFAIILITGAVAALIVGIVGQWLLAIVIPAEMVLGYKLGQWASRKDREI